MKHLAGNGMHEPTLASIVFYTLSTTRRVPAGLPPQMPLSAIHDSDEENSVETFVYRRFHSMRSDGQLELDLD